VNILPSIPKFL